MNSEKVKNSLFQKIFFEKNYHSERCWRNTLPPTGNTVYDAENLINDNQNLRTNQLKD